MRGGYRNRPDLLGALVAFVRRVVEPRDRRPRVRLSQIDLATWRQLDATSRQDWPASNTRALEEDRMRPVRLSLLVLAVLVLAAPAAAQTVVVNPTRVSFTSADHARIDRYEGGYFATAALPTGVCDPAAAAAAQPAQTDDLGHPAEVAGAVDAPLGLAVLPSRPIGCYRYKVRGIGGGLWSPWSDPSDPFALPPRSMSAPIARQ